MVISLLLRCSPNYHHHHHHPNLYSLFCGNATLLMGTLWILQWMGNMEASSSSYGFIDIGKFGMIGCKNGSVSGILLTGMSTLTWRRHLWEQAYLFFNLFPLNDKWLINSNILSLVKSPSKNSHWLHSLIFAGKKLKLSLTLPLKCKRCITSVMQCPHLPHTLSC